MSISLTIPNEERALRHASLMLFNMANDINPLPAIETPTPPPFDIDGSTGSPEATTPPPPAVVAETPAPPSPPVGEDAGIELDGDGLPWDHRIHGTARKQTAKNKWKKIRGIADEVVATVEAELRATMAASPTNPIVTTPAPPAAVEPEATTPPPPAAVAETPAPPVEVKYLVDGVEFTADQLRVAKWTEEQIAACPQAVAAPAAVEMKFPEFMSKVTAAIAAKQITDVQVTAALNTQGIISLPLLAAKPKLIGAVHLALFGS